MAWGVGVTVAGYLRGKIDPQRRLLPIIAVVVVLQLIPALLEPRKGRPDRADRAERASMSVWRVRRGLDPNGSESPSAG